MKLLADEGVEAQIVARLRADGHDVTYVAELAPGITDDAVLDVARGSVWAGSAEDQPGARPTG